LQPHCNRGIGRRDRDPTPAPAVTAVTVRFVVPLIEPEAAPIVVVPVPTPVARPPLVIAPPRVRSELQVTELVRFCVLLSFGPGGGELLRGHLDDRGICRCHRNGDQRRAAACRSADLGSERARL